MTKLSSKIFGNDWDEVLHEELAKPYYGKLRQFLLKEYADETIYPQQDDLWTAFKLTPFNDVLVVILGQDPYHGEGQAHGLSCSVRQGTKTPPSLQNIFKELHSDIGCVIPSGGDLTNWARQGVLLLNAVLTDRSNEPASHPGKGWEQFTTAVIKKLQETK